mgnify:CR=1 FL=1
MTRITKDTTIGEALQIDAGIIPILWELVCIVLDAHHQQARH